jgi:hypothetical protein
MHRYCSALTIFRLANHRPKAYTSTRPCRHYKATGFISASYNGRPSPSPLNRGGRRFICGLKTSSLKHATYAASRPLLLRSNLIQLIPKWSCTHFVVTTAGWSEPFPISRAGIAPSSQAGIAPSDTVTFSCDLDRGRLREVGRWMSGAAGILGS